MHTLYTTDAYVLHTYPHGESSKVFKLLTRDLGLVYAHGQGVRELKSRNRYTLQIGRNARVTLVKGRETWRITSVGPGRITIPIPVRRYQRRILHLVGSLIPVEDVSEALFERLLWGSNAFSKHPEAHAPLIEVVTVLRLLDILGYVARPLDEPVIAPFLESQEITETLLEQAMVHKKTLIARVNNALVEAK